MSKMKSHNTLNQNQLNVWDGIRLKFPSSHVCYLTNNVRVKRGIMVGSRSRERVWLMSLREGVNNL